MKGLIALVAVALLGSRAGDVEIRGMKHPALSPDGKKIAFDWHGDVWICPIAGGKAERLTDDPSDDEKPAWSPDGKWIAFSSDKAGNRDLYAVEVATRNVRQLTWNSADDDAPAWSPDGKWIAFQSNRDSNLDLALNSNVWDVWRMPSTGGTATRITRFRGENPAWSPDGKWIAYDRYSSGYADGEHNIFLIAPDGSGLPVEIAAGLEDSRHPTFKGTTVYFAHEANGIQASDFRNIWKTTTKGGALLQVTGHRGDQVTWPSACERSDLLVYEYDFDLYTVDPARARPRKLSITTDVRYEDPPVAQIHASGFQSPSWSPSGARVAFACRGDLWTVSIEGGAAKQLTSGTEDDRDPSWSADGTALVFCSGPPAMPSHVVKLDVKSGERTRLTKDAGPYRRPRLSPDGTRVLVTRQEEEGEDLWMIDTATHAATPWAASKESGESDGCFSPDGSRVAYLASKAGASEIVLAAIDGTDPKRLEGNRSLKRDLRWSPDGKQLAFVGQGAQNRWTAQTVGVAGGQARTAGPGALEISWSPDSTMLLCSMEARGARDGAKLTLMDAQGAAAAVALDVQVSRKTTRSDDMLGVFSQVYGSYVGNYYDPFFHGVDMPALREKYAPFAAASQTKPELYELINDMIKELHSSHIHLTPAPVKNSVVTACLGVDLVRSGPTTLEIRAVEVGSPAAKAGLQKGEAIVGNGKEIPPDWDLDRWLTAEVLRETTLEIRDADGGLRTVTVTGIDRNAMRELKYENLVEWRKIAVKAKSGGRLAYHHIKMMQTAEVVRLKATLEGDASEAEGLVLDERDGVGGLAHRPVCSLLDSTAADRLNKAPACMMRNRNGSTTLDLYGQGAAGGRATGKVWDRPVIMIQNSICRSDKEILPYTFRHLGIGYLVGMPTAGGVIGGSDWTMQDGSKITVSIQGWFTTDGRNMEGWGVPPDYRVPETHEDLYAGRDAQLEKAVEILLAQMDGKIAPPRKAGLEKKVDGK